MIIKLSALILFCNTILLFGQGELSVHKYALNDSLILIVEEELFEANEHALKVYNDVLMSIDGKPFYGTDGTSPKYKISTVELINHGDTIKLNSDCLYEVRNDLKPLSEIKILKKYNGFALQVFFSVGAGSYVVEWLVINNSSTRTLITSDMELIDLIMKSWD